MQIQVHDEIQELQPDVIVERYLDAKYYQYSPGELDDMADYNSNATYLAESDQVITLHCKKHFLRQHGLEPKCPFFSSFGGSPAF